MAGEMDKLKGKAKQAAGDLTDNEKLKREGERDELKGEAKDKADDVNDAVR